MEIKRSIYKLFITDYYQPATIIKSEFAQWSLRRGMSKKKFFARREEIKTYSW
jgi:hypothetical protein